MINENDKVVFFNATLNYAQILDGNKRDDTLRKIEEKFNYIAERIDNSEYRE